MKPLEIPYNFDMDLINVLYKIDSSGNCYHSIYCCPFKDDYIAAKHNHISAYGVDMWQTNPIDRREYIKHISYIHQMFPNKLMLLLQRNDILMEADMIRFYAALGFSKFCVGSIEQAKIIKDIDSKFEVIASITMKLTSDEINSNSELACFNGIVLFFPFNRDFEAIQNLSKKFDYTLLVNCDCNINCQGTHHWFAARDDELKGLQCPNANRIPDFSEIMRIRPMDLPLFDPYIANYKLQGREHPTSTIIMDTTLYLSDYSFYPNLKVDKHLYLK